jgi:hypothetical protein
MENIVQAMVGVSIVLFKVLRKQPVLFLYQHFGRAFLLVCSYKFGLCVCVCVTLSVLCYNLYPVIIKFLVETDRTAISSRWSICFGFLKDTKGTWNLSRNSKRLRYQVHEARTQMEK